MLSLPSGADPFGSSALVDSEEKDELTLRQSYLYLVKRGRFKDKVERVWCVLKSSNHQFPAQGQGVLELFSNQGSKCTTMILSDLIDVLLLPCQRGQYPFVLFSKSDKRALELFADTSEDRHGWTESLRALQSPRKRLMSTSSRGGLPTKYSQGVFHAVLHPSPMAKRHRLSTPEPYFLAFSSSELLLFNAKHLRRVWACHLQEIYEVGQSAVDRITLTFAPSSPTSKKKDEPNVFCLSTDELPVLLEKLQSMTSVQLPRHIQRKQSLLAISKLPERPASPILESPLADNSVRDILTANHTHPFAPYLPGLASRPSPIVPHRLATTPSSTTNSLPRSSSSQGVPSCCSSMSIDSGMSDSEDVWVDPDETFSLDLGPEYTDVPEIPSNGFALASPSTLSRRTLPEPVSIGVLLKKADRESSAPPSVPPMSRIRCELSSREREKLHVSSSVPPSLPPRPRRLSSEDRSTTLSQVSCDPSNFATLKFTGGVSLSELEFKDSLALAQALAKHGSVTLRRSNAEPASPHDTTAPFSPGRTERLAAHQTSSVGVASLPPAAPSKHDIPSEIYHYVPPPPKAVAQAKSRQCASTLRSHRKLTRIASAVRTLKFVDMRLRLKQSETATPPLPPRLREPQRSLSAPSLAVNNLSCLP